MLDFLQIDIKLHSRFKDSAVSTIKMHYVKTQATLEF